MVEHELLVLVQSETFHRPLQRVHTQLLDTRRSLHEGAENPGGLELCGHGCGKALEQEVKHRDGAGVHGLQICVPCTSGG